MRIARSEWPADGWRISVESSCVSVTYSLDGRMPLGTAAASNMSNYGHPGVWYLNRVKVRCEEQGKGIGHGLVKRLAKAVQAEGGERLIVEPGGYGSDPDELGKWYRRQGFSDVMPGQLEMVLTQDESEKTQREDQNGCTSKINS